MSSFLRILSNFRALGSIHSEICYNCLLLQRCQTSYSRAIRPSGEICDHAVNLDLLWGSRLTAHLGTSSLYPPILKLCTDPETEAQKIHTLDLDLHAAADFG